MEQSNQDLWREVERLRKELDRVADRATQREADFGAVRAKAERVEALEEKVRELSRIADRLSGGLPGETRPAALGAASAAEMESPASQIGSSGIDDLALAVAERLRATGLLADVLKGAVGQEAVKVAARAVRADSAQRLPADVDPRVLLNAIVDRLLKEVDMKLLTQRVVEALVQRIELGIRRPD